MARGRMLQNRISKSHKMASLSSDTVRLLYTWILSHLDVNGNFYADPVMVNNLVFTRLGHPVSKIASALDELEKVGLIVRYAVNGEVYLNYPDFLEKQPKINVSKEGISDIPILTPALLLTNAGVTPPEEKRREVKRSKECANANDVNVEFERFWAEYPKKVNKRVARDAWEKTKLPEMSVIIEAIKKQKLSKQWQDPQYIPNPSSWLNKERWLDELPTGGGNGSGRQEPQGRGTESPFTICPNCKMEVLKADLEVDGCVKCTKVNQSVFLTGIGKPIP